MSDNAPLCGTAGWDPCISVEWLDATVDFSVNNTTSELTITLTNTTMSPSPTFELNELFFSASSAVTGLSLVSATHNVHGDVLVSASDAVAWSLAASSGQGGPTHGDGFGIHDFSLTTPANTSPPSPIQNRYLIDSGENIAFVLDIGGTGPFTELDFVQLSGQTPDEMQVLTTAVVKFIRGDSETFPYGNASSAFGAVPEPSTALLLLGGLSGLAVMGRRRLH